jgi:DNA-binding transcriptional regulator YiaG
MARAEIDDAALKRLYVDLGWTVAKTAQAIGLSVPPVRKRLVALGLIRPRGRVPGAWAAVDTADLIRRHEAGESVADLASTAGVREDTAVFYIQHHLRRRAPLDPDELCTRYRTGESCDSLARRYGVPPTTISKHLQAAGVLVRHQHHADIDVDEVLRQRRAGISVAKIAATMRVHPNTIDDRIREAAIAARQRESGDAAQPHQARDVSWWTGPRVRALRQALRLGPAAFARRAHVSDTTVRSWESGKYAVSLRHQQRLNDLLGRCTARQRERFALLQPSANAAPDHTPRKRR